MQEMEHFLYKAPMGMEALGLEAIAKEVRQAGLDSLAHEGQNPTSPRDSPPMQIESAPEAQLNSLGPEYSHWGINE
jgi:hypothetical protein